MIFHLFHSCNCSIFLDGHLSLNKLRLFFYVLFVFSFCYCFSFKNGLILHIDMLTKNYSWKGGGKIVKRPKKRVLVLYLGVPAFLSFWKKRFCSVGMGKQEALGVSSRLDFWDEKDGDGMLCIDLNDGKCLKTQKLCLTLPCCWIGPFEILFTWMRQKNPKRKDSSFSKVPRKKRENEGGLLPFHRN